MSKRILSWFNPPSFDAPIVYPRQTPKVVVPSFIGESGQRLNLLMHHGSGDVVRDYSGFNNHGILDGFTWVDGSFGWALSHKEAVGDLVVVADSPSLRLSTVAMSVWFKPGNWMGLAYHGDLIYKNGVFPARPYRIYGGRPGERITFERWRDDGSSHLMTSIFTAWDITKWYHVVAQQDGVDYWEMYVNGVLDNTKVEAVIPSLTVGPLKIGASKFNNTIALPRIYNRMFDQPGVTRHFESTRAIFGV